MAQTLDNVTILEGRGAKMTAQRQRDSMAVSVSGTPSRELSTTRLLTEMEFLSPCYSSFPAWPNPSVWQDRTNPYGVVLQSDETGGSVLLYLARREVVHGGAHTTSSTAVSITTKNTSPLLSRNKSFHHAPTDWRPRYLVIHRLPGLSPEDPVIRRMRAIIRLPSTVQIPP